MNVLSYLFLFGFTVENILCGVVGVQTFSLALLISPLVIFLNRKRLNLLSPSMVFIIFLFIYGSVVYFLNYYSHNQYSPLIRQMLSFIAGVCLYLASSLVIKSLGFSKISKVILISSFPVLLAGVIQKISGIGYVAEGRVSAFFSEPAHYGDYLVLLLSPFLFNELVSLKNKQIRWKYFISVISLFWGLNLVFVQSGTALLKLGSLIMLIFLIFPKFLKQKIIIILASSILSVFCLIIENSYVSNLVEIGLRILKNPEIFMSSHNFYDRFYPIVGSVKFLIESKNIFGYGLGADYFEWKNIFISSQYEAQLLMKPSGSFLNSNFSKLILYFGVLGIAWIVYLFKRAFKANSPFLKIGFLNVILACFWGIASFAQPYLWFWLALVEYEKNNPDQNL